jgi:hypothetical protein
MHSGIYACIFIHTLFFATGTSLNVIVDFLLFEAYILLFSGEISCCTIIFECILNYYAKKQWIIQLAFQFYVNKKKSMHSK